MAQLNVSLSSNIKPAIKRVGEKRIKMEKKLSIQMKHIGNIVVAEAKRLMKEGYYRPVYQTGKLYKSIKASVKKSKITQQEVWVGTSVPYARFPHFGTIHMFPRPFLTDAVTNKYPEINRLMQKMKKGV